MSGLIAPDDGVVARNIRSSAHVHGFEKPTKSEKARRLDRKNLWRNGMLLREEWAPEMIEAERAEIERQKLAIIAKMRGDENG